jgi:hypothetical protein
MKIHTPLTIIPVRRSLAIGLIAILVLVVTTGFVWIETVHVIAPPGLRMVDWLWRVFVCHCSF